APIDLLHVNGNVRANQFNSVSGILNTIGTANLSFRTNNTARMTILGATSGSRLAGFVGLNTTTPDDWFHVNGNIRANQFNTVSGVLNTIGATDLSFRTNNTARMTIGANGLVGIGTASPGAVLDVAGRGDGSATDFRVGGRIQSNSAYGGVWLSDTNDGFVGNNGENIGFYTIGTGWNTFQINKTSGNVGIGTAPDQAYKLNVSGTINATSILVNGQPISGNSSPWVSNGTNTYVPSGNIGIGTSTPGAKVSFGNVEEESNTGMAWSDTYPLNYGIYKTLGSWSAPDYQQLQINWDTGIILNPGTSYGKSYVDVQGSGLRVSSGNIGIGTLAPAHKLHIVSPGVSGPEHPLMIESTDPSLYSALTLKSNAGDLFQMAQTGSSFSNQLFKASQASFYSTGSGGLLLASANTTGSIVFGTGGISEGNERMRIDNLGNVGIGTSTPNAAYKLDVAGTINATSILVNGQPVSGGSSVWTNIGTDINFLTGSVGIGKAPATGNKLDVSGAINAASYKVNGTALVGSQWATSGTNLFYNSTGNVGIGTATASTAKLNVYKAGAGTTVLIGSPTTASGNFTSLALGTTADKNGATFINSIKSAAATPAFGDLVINQNGGLFGNVGIGKTPASGYKLDVNGTINATGLLVNGVDMTVGSSIWSRTGNSIVAQGSSAGAFTVNLRSVTAGDVILALSSNTGGSAIIRASKYGTEVKPLVFQTNDAERMRIDGNGNVGIGTSNPNSDSKLNIYNGGSSTQVTIGNPSTGSGGFTGLLMGTSADTNGFGYVEAVKSSGSAYGDIILNRWGGNVGIGTTLTDAKLTVKGVIHTNEVKVDLSVQGPDYVFEKDYNLMSLEETKAYIDANKHLPEVPSAKEMEKNGVQLGEMNLLLLKKVEELTLHLIEQNKKLDEMKKENEAQNELIKSLLDKKK
ncbi:MAG: beta strand repeat-containing protein, partial [Flammeovirgaceae bacterium]